MSYRDIRDVIETPLCFVENTEAFFKKIKY